MINAEVQKLIDQGVNQRTAYRRVGPINKDIPKAVKDLILNGYSISGAYRKAKRLGLVIAESNPRNDSVVPKEGIR